MLSDKCYLYLIHAIYLCLCMYVSTCICQLYTIKTRDLDKLRKILPCLYCLHNTYIMHYDIVTKIQGIEKKGTYICMNAKTYLRPDIIGASKCQRFVNTCTYLPKLNVSNSSSFYSTCISSQVLLCVLINHYVYSQLVPHIAKEQGRTIWLQKCMGMVLVHLNS